MPNVEASKKDLEKLVGKKLGREQLEQAVECAKGEIDSWQGDGVVIDVKDTNRPDLLSAEGIAREMRGRLGKDRGVPKYEVKSSGVSLIVDKSVAGIRPCIAAAIVKNVKVGVDFLVQMIQLQEKVCMTFGRRRKEAAIGLYDWGMLQQPMHYRAYKPGEKKFIPLECRVEMDLDEILQEHPKGKEYGHLLEGHERYPIVEDDKGVVSSMPPIINSQLTGKVSGKTREVLVEVTGFRQETVNTALNVMVSALAERGCSIYSMKIRYPHKTIVTPDFTPGKISVPIAEIKSVSGLQLGNRQIVELLQKSRYDAEIKGKNVVCRYPAYRQDILHPVDVIEDIIISYGYGRIEPAAVKIPVVGSQLEEAWKTDAIREVCIGLGLQEVLTFTMSSKRKQAALIGLDEERERFVELANPVSENYAIFRKQLFPELLEFLSANRHVPYPQKIFEVGKTVELERGAETGVAEKNKLCIAMTGSDANFTRIKSVLDAVTRSVGAKYRLRETKQPFLAPGRGAEIAVGKKRGILGEISEEVLGKFELEQPVCVLEIEALGISAF